MKSFSTYICQYLYLISRFVKICASVYIMLMYILSCAQEVMTQPHAIVVPSKEASNSSFANRRTQQVTPLSDDATVDGETVTSKSELSSTYTKQIISESDSLQKSEDVDTDPSNFASLQQLLKSTQMEYSSLDFMNLSPKGDLEKSLKEFIDIDILNEQNKFNCNTCNAKGSGELLVVISLI